jgi:hypothetical protein
VGQVRIWSRDLSETELNSHALNFENVGVDNPLIAPSSLVAYWALNEYLTADKTGSFSITDLSQNGHTAKGTNFTPFQNPYEKYLMNYNYLSPSVDLKWTQNKIRIRNKSELTINDVATDTNEVALEFNLVDALNRDISKIFSSFDILNNAIGSPVNKYRDEYSDLSAYRRTYFQRLTDSIHFSQFFTLYQWFDKKISDAIKQLLPARVNFIGGEQVVESHLLERPKYTFKYPIFHTPVVLPDINVSGAFTSSIHKYVTDPAKLYNIEASLLAPGMSSSHPLKGAYTQAQFEKNTSYGQIAGTTLTNSFPSYWTDYYNYDVVIVKPFAMVASGSDIWVTDTNSHAVYRMAASNLAVKNVYGVGNNPQAILTEDSHIWVANTNDSTVTKMSSINGAITGTYPTTSGTLGVSPYNMCFDGTCIWTSNNADNTLSKISASNGALAAVYSIGGTGIGEPWALTYALGYVWVCDVANSQVYKFSASNGNFAAMYQVGAWPNDILFDGTYIWTANWGSGSISKLLASNGSTVATYGVGGAYSNPAKLISSGSFMFVKIGRAHV